MLYELNTHCVEFPPVAPEMNKGAKLILWYDNQVVMNDHDIGWSLEEVGQPLNDTEFVGLLNGKPYFTANVSQPNKGSAFSSLREVAYLSETAFSLCSRARTLLDWYRQSRYCGQCGQPTKRVANEPATSCEPCRLRFYPRISPCVIALVTRGNQVLLAQGQRHRSKGWYSTIAGFIEAGESAEQAVIREVKEEVGVNVGNLQYLNSQAWPFPNQLMLGFHAEYLSGEISPQPGEIADAQWFDIDDLPNYPPGITIAGWLIRQYLAQQNS